MVQYYRHIHGRLGRDDGGLSLNEALVKNYPPNVLEKADALLGQAKALAQGDERASNWLRLVDYAHRHFRLLAQVVHLYNAYETSRTVENLKQMQPAVAAVNAFAAEVEGLDKADPAFVRSYFPNYAIWKKDVRSNANQIGSPFKWDFDAILASNMLPGRDRNSTAIPRAAKAPVLDGKLDDEVWKQTPAQKLHEIGMGKVAAETTVRLAFDEQALYVAFECAEPLIEQMGVRECQRDGPVWRTECVEVVLDPFAEGTKMMHFIATPSATGIYDGRRGYIDDPLHPLVLKGQEDVSWNPEWRHAFTIEKERKVWTIEMAFPFTTLGVPAPAEGARWRVNFARERNRSDWPGAKAKSEPQEVYLWSPNLQKVSIIDETAFGDMYFVRKP
jgi:hypothetical protein